MKKLNFGGHLGRHLEFLKTLKGAEPAPDGILKSSLSPFRKYQNIYYTLPCHVVFGICQTMTFIKKIYYIHFSLKVYVSDILDWTSLGRFFFILMFTAAKNS